MTPMTNGSRDGDATVIGQAAAASPTRPAWVCAGADTLSVSKWDEKSVLIWVRDNPLTADARGEGVSRVCLQLDCLSSWTGCQNTRSGTAKCVSRWASLSSLCPSVFFLMEWLREKQRSPSGTFGKLPRRPITSFPCAKPNITLRPSEPCRPKRHQGSGLRREFLLA
jgi:hypothetical protein